MSGDDNKVVNIARITRQNTAQKSRADDGADDGPDDGPNNASNVSEDWEEKLAAAVEAKNKSYWVIQVNGSVRIMTKVYDEALGRNRHIFISEKDFRLLYANERFVVGVTARGNPIIKGLGEAWINHPNRLTYSQLVLNPDGKCERDEYNLWSGFGVEPKEGDWSTILDHLLSVICTGNEHHFGWLLGWLAYCVQNPGIQAEVAVVLRGLKGTGKGMVGQILANIFCDHSTHISNMKHLVGHFNSHLMNTLFLFVDEALWAGDKQGESTLKALITERVLMIEPKGVDAFQMPNRLKIIIASNNDWVVPVSADERRFFVLDVSAVRKGDTDYFDKLDAAIRGEELHAFLRYLLDLDISSFDHRNPPHTEGLNQQKLIGADSVQRFWYDCLAVGEIVGTKTDEWHKEITTRLLHELYVKYARERGDRFPMTDARMANALAKLMPDQKLDVRRPREGKYRPRNYKIPPLAEARAAFLAAMQIDPTGHAWPKEGD